MKQLPKQITRFIAGDAQADRIVPPTGYTAELTIFAAAVMAFLAIFSLALSSSMGRLADRWSDELAQSLTVRISAPAEQMDAQTSAALNVLNTTPGIASARAFTDEEQQALLAPWFGANVQIDALPIPRLIEVIEDDGSLDINGLRLRLQAEAPGAQVDDHARWRGPLVASANRLRLVGWMAILLIALTTAAIITLAANAALAANRQVIFVLRQVGARDAYIAMAFVRRFTLRALTGSAIGTALAVIFMIVLPSGAAGNGLLTDFGFTGGGWLLAVLLPFFVAGVAFSATNAAARRMLRSLT
ncbi:cell division protein FtsX [Shimia ponticola]|uniref:cell division protein FtsX n=1 Tax=Shimia ponticola TaxID=2582893 RepID=UPI0011BE358C|nr:cell division protein FtsX [Shimia ponticola]